tara:strand:- start:1106 stop:1777 length:672 start_codon:yes stop_codon:yes gene_type:complete
MSRDTDWCQSTKSERVWLLDSMTALGQFAFIAPIHRVKHWNPTTKKRNKCWAKEGECVFCKNSTPKINEFTYGLYISSDKTIKYLTLTVASHTQAQRIFSSLIEKGINPTDVVFEFSFGKVKTSFGKSVNGYQIEQTENEVFVAEKFRPSLTNSEEQSYTWTVPEEIVEYLKDKDGEPMTMIDLFLLMKEQFPAIDEKELKKYAVKLCEHNVLNLLNARQKWI